VFDPFTCLGYLAALAPRHPLHLAKTAALVDQSSDGQLVLGVASGDRPVEYPAFGLEREFERRGERFRDAFEMFRLAGETPFPLGTFRRFGDLQGLADLVPKPVHGRIPALVTGRSRQTVDWIAAKADGGFHYFVPAEHVPALTRVWPRA